MEQKNKQQQQKRKKQEPAGEVKSTSDANLQRAYPWDAYYVDDLIW